jgi:capsular polysaccharide export protein
VTSSVLRFNHKKKDKIFGAKDRRRALLLQGPVGPFFNHLQDHLEAHDLDVWRICFNAGDRFYSRERNRISFSGDLKEWQHWFSIFVAAAKVDVIILFGSERPIHRIARQVAETRNIRVIALEEGYVRPGYVTVEHGGNNTNSPLAGSLPPPSFDLLPPENESRKDFRGFFHLCRHSAVYYAMRTFFTLGRQRTLFHRRFNALHEGFCWVRNLWRRYFGQERNFRVMQRLLEHFDGNYYLVPLQVPGDSQMREAALGWNATRLIAATLESFARFAPFERRLVFKIHPLARGHSNDRAFIEFTARAFGIGDRVDVIDTGSLGLLTRHAAGMITVNSTSGLSALWHGIPLLVVGNAFYAHDELAICAHGKPDFDSFWASRQVADKALRRNYIRWVKQQAQKPGDFYAQRGMEAACQGVLERALEEEVVISRPEPDAIKAVC